MIDDILSKPNLVDVDPQWFGREAGKVDGIEIYPRWIVLDRNGTFATGSWNILGDRTFHSLSSNVLIYQSFAKLLDANGLVSWIRARIRSTLRVGWFDHRTRLDGAQY